MVCSDFASKFAVTLQCLGKLYSETVYSGKQRNIYEHIYKFIPHLLKTPQYKNIGALRETQGNIYTQSQENTLKIKTFWPH